MKPHPPEFRQRAVELAQARQKPLARLALELGISETTLRKWMRAEGDGLRAGPSARRELEALKRQVNHLAIEVELLKRATANSAPTRLLR